MGYGWQDKEWVTEQLIPVSEKVRKEGEGETSSDRNPDLNSNSHA